MSAPKNTEVLSFWEPIIGTNAAKRFLVFTWAVFLMGPLLLLLFLALFLTAEVNNPLATALAVTLGVLGFTNATAIAIAPVLARRAATRTLGVKVTMSNYPPRDSAEYRNWCTRNGLVPFSACSRGTAEED